jgi:hypothetical protein
MLLYTGAGFGTPPVMTQDLAELVSGFTRTLVHDCDLVPRTCVASLALLRSELEAQKDAVYANSSLLSSLKSSGLLEGGASLLSTVAAAAIANKVCASCMGLQHSSVLLVRSGLSAAQLYSRYCQMTWTVLA